MRQKLLEAKHSGDELSYFEPPERGTNPLDALSTEYHLVKMTSKRGGQKNGALGRTGQFLKLTPTHDSR